MGFRERFGHTKSGSRRSFADWLQARESAYDEIIGYHLEQAYRLRTELGHRDEVGHDLATRAGERLATAGRRAWGRGDTSAAINLLERAADLYPSDDVRRLEFSPELGNALFHAGRLTDAATVLAKAVEDAKRLGRQELSLVAAVHLADLGIHTSTEASLEETMALAGARGRGLRGRRRRSRADTRMGCHSQRRLRPRRLRRVAPIRRARPCHRRAYRRYRASGR